jgi:penicillin-binding protein 2
MNKKSKFILFIFCFVWAGILLKVYNISVKNASKYKKISLENISRTDYIPTLRGIIYDRNNIPLVVNKVGFSISLKSHLKSKILDAKLKKLKKYFPKLNIKNIRKKYKKKNSRYSHKPIKIVNFIAYNDFINVYSRLHIDEAIYVKPSFKRRYLYKEAISHILGYVSKNQKAIDNITKYTKLIPKSGIELYYNKHLQGELNYVKYKVNALNEKIKEVDRFVSTKNNNITLSIDIRLQKYIYNLFKEDEQKKAGVALVSNVQTGEILSAVSFPSFDANIFTDRLSSKKWNKLIKNKYKPFTNKIIRGLYPPASIIKMGVGMALLKNGLSSREAFVCEGSYHFAGRNFRCWNSKGHGRVNLNRAIRESCDDYFYKASYKIGINNISQTLQYFGFGHKTGIDLKGEKAGISPNKEWKLQTMKKPWFIGETFLSSIGQGSTLSTPIQVHKYVTSIASGKIITPHFIKKLGNKTIDVPSIDIKDEYKKYLNKIRQAMYQVCNYPSGTGYKYTRNSLKTLACKTGTAQVISISQARKKRRKEGDLKYSQRSHAWFVAYTPFKKPKYSITILTEHGGHGSINGIMATNIINYMRRNRYF